MHASVALAPKRSNRHAAPRSKAVWRSNAPTIRAHSSRSQSHRPAQPLADADQALSRGRVPKPRDVSRSLPAPRQIPRPQREPCRISHLSDAQVEDDETQAARPASPMRMRPDRDRRSPSHRHQGRGRPMESGESSLPLSGMPFPDHSSTTAECCVCHGPLILGQPMHVDACPARTACEYTCRPTPACLPSQGMMHIGCSMIHLLEPITWAGDQA